MSASLSRREWLQGTLAQASLLTAAGVAAASLKAGPDTDKYPWIDAHSHIWTRDIQKYPLAPGKTLDDLKPPSFTTEELLEVAHKSRVGRVVLIGHSIFYLWDNTYMVDAAKAHPGVFRIVGMVDEKAPRPGAAMKKLLPQHVTGFRITPFVSGEEWLESDGMNEMWKTGAETGQKMCCLIGAEHLAAVDAMCAKHAGTPVVIDHFARIGYDGEIRDAEIDALCRLARHKHTYVKISAYYALGKKQPPHTELIPMIRRLIDAFGVERLMWASDAPYQLTGGNTYADSIALITDRMDGLSAGDRQHLLQTTAEKVFWYE